VLLVFLKWKKNDAKIFLKNTKKMLFHNIPKTGYVDSCIHMVAMET